ncbi:MAG: protein-L-isoaspartate O-methyltransferase [Ahrensia sp.]|nr:protein-L-isoaspartate O-methyltransferase [Ahrensia sp.]
MDFEQARVVMVDRQIRPNDVTRADILEAFLEVPREEFVPSEQQALAYMDEDIALAGTDGERYLIEPTAFAKLVQLANPGPDDIVLDIGCATGYTTAILSRLCGSVVALESDAGLGEGASETLMRLSFGNVAVVSGDLAKGYPKEAPYDVVFVSGSVGEVRQEWLDQLKPGGRLVVVEGSGNTGKARLYLRGETSVSSRTAFNSAIMPLPGLQREPEFQF